jgi:hypothetical protein
VWLPFTVISVIAFKAWRRWREPSIDDFVELVAYAAGLLGTGSIVQEAISQGREHVEIGLAEMIGAVLLAYVSARGAWRIYVKDPIAKPTRDKPTTPTALGVAESGVMIPATAVSADATGAANNNARG